MNFGSVTGVTRIDKDGGSSAVPYRVFYYQSDIASAADVYSSVEKLKYDTAPLPAGWSDTPGGTVTAIAVAVP